MKSQKKQLAKLKKRQKIKESRTINKRALLWKLFLKNEEKEFREYYKFGKAEIERIGIDKFFQIMGFEKKEDLSKWKTDALHICICPDCGKDFGIYEFYSLCASCEKNYDMSKVQKAHTLMVSENKNEANPGEFLFMFMMNKQLRNFYLLNAGKNTTVIYALKYQIDSQDWHVSLLEDLKEGDTVKFILSDGNTYKEDDKDVFRITFDVSRDNASGLLIEYEAIDTTPPINVLSD